MIPLHSIHVFNNQVDSIANVISNVPTIKDKFEFIEKNNIQFIAKKI